MKKNSKKALATTMCTVMMLGAVAPIVSAKAEEAPATLSNVSAFGLFDFETVTYNLTEDLSGSSKIENNKFVVDVKYQNLFGRVKSDFDSKYKDNYLFANKVMMGDDQVNENESITGDKWPVAVYTVNFPSGVKPDIQSITTNLTSASFALKTPIIKPVKNDDGSTTVNFTFKLGNWNDYGTYFSTIEKEMDSNIKIEIPFSIENGFTSGNITDSGSCELYYYKWGLKLQKVIDVTIDPSQHEITR